MIRVNLLRNRREPVDGLEAAIAATGPSAFINRREIVLGGLFLALGAGILYLNSVAGYRPDGGIVAVASAEGTTGPTAQPSPGAAAPARLESAAPLPPRAAAHETAQPLAEAKPSAPAAAAVRPSAPPEPRGARTVDSLVSPAPLLSAAGPLRKRAPQLAEAAASSLSRTPQSPLVPGELSSLAVSILGPRLHILATIGNQPAYQMFRLNSPNRVVVDLSGVTLALPASERQITAPHPLVQRIRIAQFQVSPPKVRLVFDVPEFPAISIQPAPGGLAFQVATAAP